MRTMKEKSETEHGEDAIIHAVKTFCSRLLRAYSRVIRAMWILPPREGLKRASDVTIIILFNDVEQVDHITKKSVRHEAELASLEVADATGIIVRPVFYDLSDYWDMVRRGSLTTFEEIREGIPVYDPSGFFVPLKKLLFQGRVPGTKEAIRASLEKAPKRVLFCRFYLKTRALECLYNAVVAAGQAPLMIAGYCPPPPKRVAEKLEKAFVERGLLEPEYPGYCRDIVSLYKSIEHGEIKEVSGEVLDSLIDKARLFIKRMERLVKELEKTG